MINILPGKGNRNRKNLQKVNGSSKKDPEPCRLSRSELKNTCCPHCHQKGTLSYSKSYPRYFFSSVQDIQKNTRISIAVYYCASCRTFHSLFPEDVCPFSHYSYSLIHRIISHFKSHGLILAHTARTFQISVKTLKRLIALWNQNINLFKKLFVKAVSFGMTARNMELFLRFYGCPFLCAQIRAFSPSSLNEGKRRLYAGPVQSAGSLSE